MALIEFYNNIPSRNFDAVTVIAKPNEARKILAELLVATDFCLEEAFLYDNEVAISIVDDSIFCEGCKNIKDEYKKFIDKQDVFFIINNCSSSIIKNIKSDRVFEVELSENVVDKKTYTDASIEIKKKFEEFDDVYTEMIRHSLLFQCSYRDLYNQLLKDIWL